jgi:hypothetical protein
MSVIVRLAESCNNFSSDKRVDDDQDILSGGHSIGL